MKSNAPGIVLVSVALVTLIACKRDSRGEKDSLPDGSRSAVPEFGHQPSGSALHLVVGDTVPISLDTGVTIRFEPWTSGSDRVGARIQSDSGRFVTVLGDSAIVALDSGSATITATNSRSPGVQRSVRIDVISRQRAANELAAAMCPNEDGKRVAQMLATQPMSASADPIHEFNDCQRLIDGDEYRDLVGIFVDRELQRLNDPAQFRNGPLVATVYDMTGSAGVGYSRLGLGTGKSCLYLRYRTATGWKAALVAETRLPRRNDAEAPTTCEDAISDSFPAEAWKGLAVVRTQGVDFKRRRIAPPVARWDWDAEHRYNYIGIKCGIEDWCEIGLAGKDSAGRDMFKPSDPISYGNSGPPYIIKGYYDEQLLADAKGKHPTTVFGRITPGDAIKDPADMHDHDPTKLYAVADIELFEKYGKQSPEFVRYVGLYTGQQPAAGDMTARTTLELTPDPGGSLNETKAYKGHLNRKPLPDESIHYFRHAGRPPFGIVRWRWTPDDESTWSYCDPEGCCDSRQLLETSLLGR